MVNEGLIDIDEAIGRIDPASLELVLRPMLDPDAKKKVIARGLDASPGAATGRVVFHSDEAQELAERGESVILVRMETSPEDIQGMTVSTGILTSRGGQTSHAAVVARGMGRPCVVGCSEIAVDYARALFYAGDTVIRRGDWITIDGGTGEVMGVSPHHRAAYRRRSDGAALGPTSAPVSKSAPTPTTDPTPPHAHSVLSASDCAGQSTCSSNRMHSARCDR